ncbi:MAG: PadR family transcriptional regulator [Caldisericaceae bacterium]
MEEEKNIFGFCNQKRNFFVATFFGAREFITFYILHLLTEKKMYGEEISNKIRDLLSNLWDPNPGFIYPVLKKLERYGLIKGVWVHEESHPRYVYQITDKGMEKYDSLYSNFGSKLDEFVKVINNVKEEIFKKPDKE